MSLFHGRPLVGTAYQRIVNMCFMNRALRETRVKRCFNMSKLCLKSMFYNIFSSTFASSFSWY